MHMRNRVSELSNGDLILRLIQIWLADEWQILHLLIVHNGGNTGAQILEGSWLSGLARLLRVLLVLILLRRLISDLEQLGDIRRALGHGAFHALAGLNQEFPLLNFLAGLKGLVGNRNSNIGFLDGVGNSLAITSQDSPCVARVVERRNAEWSRSFFQRGRHNVRIFLVLFSLGRQVRPFAVLLVQDRGPDFA